MTTALRVILWIFGILVWMFWMYLAYQSDFLGMLSDGDPNAPYHLRFFFWRIPIQKTPGNRKRILLAVDLFGFFCITYVCFFA